MIPAAVAVIISSPKIILAIKEIAGKSSFSCYLRVVGADSRRRGMRRGPAGGATLATSRLVAPPRLVGLEPTGHLPQVGEAMRPRSEVGATGYTPLCGPSLEMQGFATSNQLK